MNEEQFYFNQMKNTFPEIFKDMIKNGYYPTTEAMEGYFKNPELFSGDLKYIRRGNVNTLGAQNLGEVFNRFDNKLFPKIADAAQAAAARNQLTKFLTSFQVLNPSSPLSKMAGELLGSKVLGVAGLVPDMLKTQGLYPYSQEQIKRFYEQQGAKVYPDGSIGI